MYQNIGEKNKGFSLVELLTTIAVISIFTAMSSAGYHKYVDRAHKSDGKTALLDLGCRMEDYYFKHNTYVNASIATGKHSDVLNTNKSPEGWYILSISDATPISYTLRAAPIGRGTSLILKNTGG